MRARLAIFILLPAVAASGCASIVDAKNQAPVWFEQAQRELKGEGYPDLRAVPEGQAKKVDEAAWDAQATVARRDAAALDKQAADLGPIPSSDDIRARLAQELQAAGLDPAPK